MSSVEHRLFELESKFQLSTGHMHTGAAGDAPIIPVGGALVAIYEDSTDKGDVNTLKFTTGIDVSVTGATATISVDKTELFTNSTVLDGITSTLVSNWGTAYSQTHVHNQLSALETTGSPSFVGLTLSGMTTAGILHNAVTTGIVSSSLIVNADITGHTITYASIQEVSATSRILGRVSAGAGDIEELTGANVRTITGLATGDSPSFTGLTLSGATASGVLFITPTLGTVSTDANFIFASGALTVPALIVTDLDATSIVVAGTAGRLADVAGLTWDGTNLVVPQLKDSGLTATRMVFVGASSILTDVAGLTWDGTYLVAPAINLKSGATSLGTFSQRGAFTGTALDLLDGSLSMAQGGFINDTTSSGILISGNWKYTTGTIKLVKVATDAGAAGIAHIAPAAGDGAVTSSLIVNNDVSATAAIAHTKLANSSALTLFGNSAGTPQAPGELSAANAKVVLAMVPADITFAATSRVLGRISAGGGAGEELTAANLKTICSYYTSGDSPSFANITSADGSILFTDADVAHGMTDVLPTTQYGNIGTISATAGGLKLMGLSDDTGTAFNIVAISGGNPANSVITLQGGKKNGTDWQAVAAAETVFKLYNYTTSLLEILGNGNSTFAGSITSTGLTVNGAGLFSHSSYQTITTTAASTGARLLYLKQKSDADYGMQFNVDNQSTGDLWLQRVEAGSDAEIWCVFRPTGIVDFNYAISSAGLTVNGATVLNEGGADVDFRVEADTEANGLFFDGTGAGSLHIGGNTQNQKLNVYGGMYLGGSIYATASTPVYQMVDSAQTLPAGGFQIVDISDGITIRGLNTAQAAWEDIITFNRIGAGVGSVLSVVPTEVQTITTVGQQALTIDQNDIDQAFIDFQGESEAGAAKNLSTWTNAALEGFIKIEINGTAKWIPYYAAPTS